MATLAICTAPFSVSGMHIVKPLRKINSWSIASTSRTASSPVRAAQVQSVPPSCKVESLPLKVDVEDAFLFTDDTKGIVCYRTEAGEVICEGMDEGPHFYPPCGSNFYMPDTRAAAILPLLGEVMYEI